MEILGYISAILIGGVLGLIGGGGSILAVPAMVYLLGIPPSQATAYSLFIVGISSLFGAGDYIKKKQLDFRTAIVFAVPSFIAVYLTRKFLVPAIPDPIFTIFDWTVTKDAGLMIFFGLIMLFSSFSMIKSGKKEEKEEATTVSFNYPMIVLEGAFVGVLTGVVGAGGGFLIIPALVLFAKLPMKLAVGTSLLIIAAKSLIGFIGDIQSQVIEWKFLLIFTALSIVGIFIGGYTSKYVPGSKLKAGFGWFVLLMAVYILVKETYFKTTI